MADAITFSTVQLVIAVLVFSGTVASALLAGAVWLDRRRSEGDRLLHGKVDRVVESTAKDTAKIREEFVRKTDFQRHQDRMDDAMKGIWTDIKGGFDRINDRFDRLLASRSANTDHGDD